MSRCHQHSSHYQTYWQKWGLDVLTSWWMERRGVLPPTSRGIKGTPDITASFLLQSSHPIAPSHGSEYFWLSAPGLLLHVPSNPDQGSGVPKLLEKPLDIPGLDNNVHKEALPQSWAPTALSPEEKVPCSGLRTKRQAER